MKLFRKWPPIETLRWILAIWVTSLVIVSLQPVRFGATSGGTKMHVILHIVAFGFPAFLLQVTLNRRAWASATALVLFSALSLAIGIELAQSLMYKNAFEWADLRADLLGTVIAILPRLLIGDNRGRNSA